MKFKTCIFPVRFTNLSNVGIPVGTDFIGEFLGNAEDYHIREETPGGVVEGYGLHVAGFGASSCDTLLISDKTKVSTLTKYLLGLQVGTIVMETLNCGTISSVNVYRRTADGFNKLLSTSNDATEGVYVNIF